MENTPLLSKKDHLLSKTEANYLLRRRRALEESGVGHAGHLIKDAVFGQQDAPYEGETCFCYSLPAIFNFDAMLTCAYHFLHRLL